MTAVNMNLMIFFVYTVKDPKTDKADEWFTHLKMKAAEIQYKLDTGRQVSIITEQLFNKLRKKSKTHKSQIKRMSYSGNSIPIKGTCVLTVKTTSLQAALRGGIRITHPNHRSQCLQQIRTGQESVHG